MSSLFFFRNEEKLQCSPIIMLDLGSIEMDSVVSESFCKGTLHGNIPIIPL